jgi:hypothetical protein
MKIKLPARTLLCRWFGWSDRPRWTNTKELLPEWDERTRILAGLLPINSRVIEFGAGRRQLELYLPAGCTYIASDLVDRGGDTLVCDLNVEPRPELRRLGVDTAVFGGVLEYIQNLESLVRWVAREVDRCLVSYECARTRPSDRGRLHESFTRAQVGWVNTFHEDDFVLLFEREGFLLARRELWRTKDGCEPIFLFERKRSGSAAESQPT